MKYVDLKARAKINLTLDVLGKRDDGYHDLKMIMQTIKLYDAVHIEKMYGKDHINLKTNIKWLPTDERNLAYKAALMMKDEFGIDDGVFIGLDKKIPVSAGLAGGSTDCAAVIVGMNRLFKLKAKKEKLMEIGAKLGSDVPYCIFRGTALAEGRGEVLTKLPPCPHFYIVLAKPNVSVSTAEVYRGLKLNSVSKRPNTEEMIFALNREDKDFISRNICNVLESVTLQMVPEIEKIKEKFMETGALNAMMSGSGPTVFALYEDLQQAHFGAMTIKDNFKIKDIYVTETFSVK